MIFRNLIIVFWQTFNEHVRNQNALGRTVQNFPAKPALHACYSHSRCDRHPLLRAGANWIRVEDLRRLLHALGRGLPHWLVREAAGVLATAVRLSGFRVWSLHISKMIVVGQHMGALATAVCLDGFAGGA